MYVCLSDHLSACLSVGRSVRLCLPVCLSVWLRGLIFLAQSTYLEPQKLVTLGLQLRFINHKNHRGLSYDPGGHLYPWLTFYGKKNCHHITIKAINIVTDGGFWFLCKTLIFLFLPFLTLVSPKSVYRLKTALDKPLLVQNLITSGNAISLWIWWIWNSLFWLGALWEQGKIGLFLSKVFEVWAKK